MNRMSSVNRVGDKWSHIQVTELHWQFSSLSSYLKQLTTAIKITAVSFQYIYFVSPTIFMLIISCNFYIIHRCLCFNWSQLRRFSFIRTLLPIPLSMPFL